ncbi:MAG: alpha/beta hydrolase [Vicinamibacterales bacterium]
MNIIDIGSGPAVVLIPGIQGRWEWMRPAVNSLSKHCRVITFSLADERTSGTWFGAFDEATGFNCYVEQVRQALDAVGIESAAICGVSYGGLIAAAFAARYPRRTTCAVLVSALPPSWTPSARVRFYLRSPRLLSPLFCIGALRMYPEIAAASRTVSPGIAGGTHRGIGGSLNGMGATMRIGWNAVTHMFSPSRMARRVRLVASLDLRSELAAVQPRVLIMTGEERLDRVVPTDATREYARLWPQSAIVTLERTGHIGLITRPSAFAALVADFVTASDCDDKSTHISPSGPEPVGGNLTPATGIIPGERRVG